MRSAVILLVILIFSSCGKSEQGSEQGTIDLNIEDRNKAVGFLNEAVTLIGNSVEEGAFENIKQAIAVDSIFRDAYLQIYSVAQINGNYSQEMLAALEKGKSIYTDDDQLFFYTAEFHRAQGNQTKAQSDYTKAINLSKVNGEDFELVPYYYFNRANGFLKDKNHQEALADYSDAIRLNPNFASALANRGTCLYMLKRKSEACGDWEKGSELGSSHAAEYLLKHCK